MKKNLVIFALIALVFGCNTAKTTTTSAPRDKTIPLPGADSLPNVPDSKLNRYKGIPVEVAGIPYEFEDITGNKKIDDLFDQQYANIFTWQSAQMINFTINKFFLDFKSDGSLVMTTFYSYDKTPSSGESYYPAMDNKNHDWNLQPLYNRH